MAILFPAVLPAAWLAARDGRAGGVPVPSEVKWLCPNRTALPTVVLTLLLGLQNGWKQTVWPVRTDYPPQHSLSNRTVPLTPTGRSCGCWSSRRSSPGPSSGTTRPPSPTPPSSPRWPAAVTCSRRRPRRCEGFLRWRPFWSPVLGVLLGSTVPKPPCFDAGRLLCCTGFVKPRP